MKKIRKSLELLSPEMILSIASFVAAFSLLLSGIHIFCRQQESSGINDVKESPAQIQENLAKNIIRLHVIANSDAEYDQQLKLKVRDAIIVSLQEALDGISSIEQAREVIQARQGQIENTARRTVVCGGSPYDVKVSLQPRYFPVKQYGDLCFPAGVYDALCVEIGEAEGRNWWCVLFPSLCFVNETTATVPETSKEKLRERLSEEEYETISEEGEEKEPRPELHFGILDWLEGLG